MNGSKILVLGVAYKQDIDDYRESPAIKVIEELKKNQAEVDFYDPWIKSYRYRGQAYSGIDRINEKIINSYE